jgi:plastocyanin
MNTHAAFSTLRRSGLALAIAALALAGCNKSKSNNPVVSGPTANVSIVMNAFNMGANAYAPDPLTVAAGTTVIWKNNDSQTHTVTSTTAGESYNMAIAPGSTGSHLFSNAGTFTYHCTVSGHTMNGSVVVNP